ncbi:hypothetical protein YC2023_066365 [Brassica napus]
MCVRLCPSAHTGHPWLSISTHISTLVLRLSTLALPVDCLGDFGPGGLSVQYTQDVCGCPSAHKRRPWQSMFVSSHKTSDVRGYPSGISTLVLGLSMLALPVDCLGDFGPRGLSVQYTQDVHGCPPAHTGRPWLSVAVRQYTQDVRGCLCVSVCVRQHTQDVRGCPSVHISARWSLDSARWPFPWTVWVILAPVGRLFSTHRTSMAHTGRPWLSISTHISKLVLGVSTLTLPVDCSGDFCPRGLSVQYAQDVCGCPPAHTGRLWLLVCVHVCPSVSVSTHMTSVAVHQYTYQNVGPRTQHTQDVRGCSPAHTGLLWLSVAVH